MIQAVVPNAYVGEVIVVVADDDGWIIVEYRNARTQEVNFARIIRKGK